MANTWGTYPKLMVQEHFAKKWFRIQDCLDELSKAPVMQISPCGTYPADDI